MRKNCYFAQFYLIDEALIEECAKKNFSHTAKSNFQRVQKMVREEFAHYIFAIFLWWSYNNFGVFGFETQNEKKNNLTLSANLRISSSPELLELFKH